MIRGIDITQLLTTGDQTGLRFRTQQSRHAIGGDTYRIKQINDALDADSSATISKSRSEQAKKFLGDTLDSVYSRNLLRDGDRPSDTVRSDDSFSDAVDRMGRFMSENIMGLGTAALLCEAQVTPVSSEKLTCEGLVGNGLGDLGCDATVVPVAGFQLTSQFTADATVQSSAFQVIDYRWADNVAENPWKNHADPYSFANDGLEFGEGIYLAVRIRLYGSVALTGNDWALNYRLEPNGSSNDELPWTEITATSDIFRIFNPLSGRLSSTVSLDKANAVTRPGPGNPETHSLITIAQVGAQSPTLTSSNPDNNTEVEVWFPLWTKTFTENPSISLGPESLIYFRLESTTLVDTGLDVIAGNATTSSYWWQAPIDPA